MLEVEARKYKEEYSRICDILKSKINDTINNTVGSRRWYGFLFLKYSLFLGFINNVFIFVNKLF